MSDMPRIPPRTPADQLRALGYETPRGPVDDTPRWHLEAAGEALEDGRLEDAEEALARGREGLRAGSPDEDEAAYLALGVALLRADVGGAEAEIRWLAGREGDGSARARGLLGAASAALSGEARARLLALLPGGDHVASHGWDVREMEIPDVPLPPSGLPMLPDEEEMEFPAEQRDGRGTPLLDAPAEAQPPAPPVAADGPDGLRERLVEQLLAGPESPEVLFAVAMTLLRCGHLADAEVLFAAAAEAPELRLAAWEGLMEILVRSGRSGEAVSTALRLTRVHRGAGEALAGIRRWGDLGAAAAGSGRPT